MFFKTIIHQVSQTFFTEVFSLGVLFLHLLHTRNGNYNIDR